jgi:site-specific DNA recombinase
VLHRELYRGVIQWNRTRKRGADGQVRPQPRPEADYIDRSAPELRIVPEDLWLAAHQAMDAAVERHPGRGFGPWGPGGRGSYLLTGLAKCGECGGGIEVQTRSHGSRRAKFYTCGRSYKAGLEVCSNRTAIGVESVDAALLDAIRAGVLSDDVRRAAIADVILAAQAYRGGPGAAERDDHGDDGEMA